MDTHFDLCRDQSLETHGQRHSAALPAHRFLLEPGRTFALSPHRQEASLVHGLAIIVKCQNMTKICHVLTLDLIERPVAPTYGQLKAYEANQQTHPQTQSQFKG